MFCPGGVLSYIPLTVENVTLLVCLLSLSLSDKSNLSVYWHTALNRYPDNLLNCHLNGRYMVLLFSIKTEIDYQFSDLNPFNYCPLVIVQVDKSSDMHSTTFLTPF